jgi:hypothetical protein
MRGGRGEEAENRRLTSFSEESELLKLLLERENKLSEQ